MSLLTFLLSDCGESEHQYGWRSEYAAIRSIIKITGDIILWSKQQLLLDLRERYDCRAEATEL
jgi:hypothetical protein